MNLKNTEMTEKENDFLRNLQKTMWTAFSGLMLIIIIGIVPFYFNTNYELKKTQEQILKLEATKANKELHELTINQIQKELENINKKLDKR